MSLDSLSAADLLEQARSGDRRALRRLCERQRPKLEAEAQALGRTLGDRRDVSTAVDELLSEVGEHFFRFRGATEDEFSAWLADQLRIRARRLGGKQAGPPRRVEAGRDEAGPSSFEWFEADPQDETVVAAQNRPSATERPAQALPTSDAAPALPPGENDGLLSALPELQQRVVRGRLLAGRTIAQLAGDLNQPPAAVVGLLRLALQSLQFVASGQPNEQQTWVPSSRGDGAQIDAILARFLAFRDAGDQVTSKQLIQEHPDFEPELAEFFQTEKYWRGKLAHAEQTLSPEDPRAKALPPPPRLARPAESFGDYELLDQIARGGMGVVYKAKQKSLNRVVAVKMVLAGQFARAGEVERFYNEAAHAAKLTHPNIVRIYEVGQADGQPYFSMDYIEGGSLADLLRRGPLSETRAAYLLKLLADAVQYAHSQGIIHRDLKPANVLMDKRGQPHITDFGLAKQTEADERITASGAVLGTPNYMPPEQAAGRLDEICPASDVYGLGAILYEMLTGRPPFEAATSYDVLSQVLKHDAVAPRIINPAVPVDLETICEKCLRKDPAARYLSAAELSAELQRYLDGEPIQARPMSTIERATGWCKRNPGVSALSGGILAAMAVAVVAVVVSLFQTRAAWEVADASFRDAKAAVDDFFLRVSEETLLNQPGLQVVRRDLLERAAEYYRKFLKLRANDPGLREELAETRFRVGKLTEELDSPGAAMEFYDEALAEQQKLLAEQPQNLRRQAALGDTYNARAVALQKQNLGDRARSDYVEALRLRKGLADKQPKSIESVRKLANTRMNLALLERDEGHGQGAIDLFDEAQDARLALLQTQEDAKVRRDLGLGYYNLGALAMAEGDPKFARGSFRSAITTFEALLAKEPENQANRASLALVYRLLADLAAAEKTNDEANSLYEKARVNLEQLAQENPQIPEHQFALAGVTMNLGQLAREKQEPTKAREQFEAAEKLLTALQARSQSDPRVAAELKKVRQALMEP